MTGLQMNIADTAAAFIAENGLNLHQMTADELQAAIRAILQDKDMEVNDGTSVVDQAIAKGWLLFEGEDTPEEYLARYEQVNSYRAAFDAMKSSPF